MKALKCLSPILLIFLSVFTFAEERTENLDHIIVVDKSLSMEDKMPFVIEYLIDTIGADELIPGDSVTLIQFYGQAELILQKTIATEADEAEVERVLRNIQGNGRYTDIGNALDFLNGQIPLLPETENLQYFLLLTDGIQEAPPESPYFTEDGSFSSELLENARKIKQQGWTVHVLGLGSETQAEQIAQELEGTVHQFDNPEEIAEATADFTSRIQWIGGPVIDLGSTPPTLQLAFEAQGIREPQTLTLDSYAVKYRGKTVYLDSDEFPASYTVEEDGTYEWIITLKADSIPQDLPESFESVYNWTGDQPIAGVSEAPRRLGETAAQLDNPEVQEEGALWETNPVVFWILIGMGLLLLITIVFIIIKNMYFKNKRSEEDLMKEGD
jgi:Mg-chelatase subunit ChlD